MSRLALGIATPAPIPQTRAMKFHEKLRKAREARSLAQHELAAMVGRWQSRVSNLERPPAPGKGEVKVEPSLLCKLAEVLEVPISYLCDEAVDDPDAGARPDPAAQLSEEDRRVLALAHVLGHDRALARLLQADPHEPATMPPPAAAPARTLGTMRMPPPRKGAKEKRDDPPDASRRPGTPRRRPRPKHRSR